MLAAWVAWMMMGGLAGDTVPQVRPAPLWSAHLEYQQEWLPATGGERVLTGLRLGRRLGRGALLVQGLRAEEPGGEAYGGGAEVYFPVGERNEVRLEGGHLPGLLAWPEWRAGGEMTHYFTRGWTSHLGASYRRYQTEDVTQLALGLGREQGAWSVLSRVGAAQMGAEVHPSANLVAMHRLDEAGSRLVGFVAGGSEVLDFLPGTLSGPELLSGRSWSAGGEARLALTSRTLLSVGGNHTDLGRYGSRIQARAGLELRW